MNYFKKKCGTILAMGIASFLVIGVRAAAMDDAYRTPALSGPTETWVYQGEAFESSRNRVFADDQEDGDLTAKIRKSGNVDTSKTGSYTVHYQVTDSDGKTAQMQTVVNVLDKNDASSEDKTVKRILYTLPDASHLTNIGFNRGYYHDRQSLGIWIPEGETLTIRLVNGEEFHEDLDLQFMNNDSETEKISMITQKTDEETGIKKEEISEASSAIKIPSNGEWITVKNRYVKEDGTEGSADSVPFIVTPKNTTVQPVIEIQWNDSFQEVPYYRYGDNQDDFFREWDESKAPFAIIEGDAATFLVPVVDRNNIINNPNADKEYKKFKTIDEMLEWYAAFVRQYDEYSGLDFDAEEEYNQNVRAKFFIKVNNSGIGSAYYTTDHSANNGAYSNGSLGEYLIRAWVALHEFGHGYEGSIAEQENPFVETTNNIMGYYFEETYRPDTDFGWLLDNFAQYNTKVERYKALGEEAEKRRNETTAFSGIVEGAQNYNVSLFMFTNVLDKLGPQKTVAAMHTQYRKYCYENGKTTSSSDVITDSFSRTGGYNVIPYFDSWHIQPSEKIEEGIYGLDLPMVYYLKNLVGDDAACEKIRAKLGLDSIYSLVTTEELAYTGYTSQARIHIAIHDLSQILNKNIVIKNGAKVVKEIPVTAEDMTVELPVGIYEVELPLTNSNDYCYGNEYLVAAKGSVSAEYEYFRQTNPMANDLQIKFNGIGTPGWNVASVSIDTEKKVLTWKVNSGMPHVYFDETYISIRVLDASGKEIFSQSLKGNEMANQLEKEVSFDVGSKIEIYHLEASSRLKFVSKYTEKELSAYKLSDDINNATYVMTDKGLMQEEWNKDTQSDAYLNILNSYSEYILENLTLEDLYYAEKFHNQKAVIAQAFKLLDEESQAEYLAEYGILMGKTWEYYTKIDSSSLTGSADSEQGGEEAASSAVDGNESTIWHSKYSGGPNIKEGINNSYTILLDQNMDIGKMEYVPRRGGGNGVILSYSLAYSTTESGDDFKEIPVEDNTWADNDSIKSVKFDAPNARRIRIKALATTGSPADTYISAAEFYLYKKVQILAEGTYLSDLYLESSGTSVQKDKNADGQPISLYVDGQAKSFEKGLGMAAGTTAVVDLAGKNFEVFSAMAGVDASQTRTDGAVLEIYGDGNLLYQSEKLLGGAPAELVYLDISGISKLEIKVIGENANTGVSLGNACLRSSRDLTDITLKKGESAAIIANTSLIPSERKFTWESSDETVAVVDNNGVVTAVREGEAVVSGVSKGETVTCAVHVVKTPPEREWDEARAKKQEALAQAKAVYDAGRANYTVESWTAFQAAYEALNNSSDGMSASELEALTAKLKEAQGRLEEKASDGKTETPNRVNSPEPEETIKEGQIYNSGSYYYKVTSISKMTAQVTGLKKKELKKITIYNTVTLGGKKYQVTSVAPSAFKNNKRITSVTIQKNVEVIGNSAFAGCTKLKKVAAKSTKLKNIGSKAFYNCKKLTNITIKSKVLKKAGKNAFKGISKKAVIKVPAAKLKAYTKLLAKKGQSKTVKIKK